MSDAPVAATASFAQDAVVAIARAGEPEPVASDGHVRHVIETSGLTKVYPGGRIAVDHLDLAVREAEIFALLGPNGAGKTTTVGMLTGRVVPTAGTAIVNGVDVAADPGLAKAAVGVVSQLNTLDRGLNVEENLYFHARYFGFRDKAARAATAELLERFHLTGRARATIGSLSGGLARRVMLARAFLARPAVLFLDEPTAGLDPQSRLVLWDLLRELHAEGETIFLTTHYMEEAERLADRVAIMDRGKLLALDTPVRLRNHYGGGSVLVLRPEGDLEELAHLVRGLACVVDADRSDTELRIRLTEDDTAADEVLDAVKRGGHALHGLALEGPSLETVFIELTGKELRE